MKIKQLSALLLAISISVVPSVSAADKDKPLAKKPHADNAINVKSEKAKKTEAKKKVAPRKKFKKSRGIRPVKKSKKVESVAKIGKFNRNGDIRSFSLAANRLIEFMKSQNASAQMKQLFSAIARFNHFTGSKLFSTTAHYEQTVNLLREASKHSALFGRVRIRLFINKWLKEKEEQLKDPKKRVSAKAVKKEKPSPRAKKAELKKAELKKAEFKKAELKKAESKKAESKKAESKRK